MCVCGVGVWCVVCEREGWWVVVCVRERERVCGVCACVCERERVCGCVCV